MHTVFSIPIIDVTCPSGIDESKCPLRKFIKTGQDALHVTTNESYLEPSTKDVCTIIRVVLNARSICNNCQINKGKIR